MKQITDDYCSFEISKLLKEKGFEQDCDYATSWYAAKYYKNSALGEWFEGEHQIIEDIDDKCAISYLSDEGVFIPAPTQSLALKWLMEVHNIDIEVYVYSKDFNGNLSYAANIRKYGSMMMTDDSFIRSTYEESIEAALKYTLENLI